MAGRLPHESPIARISERAFAATLRNMVAQVASGSVAVASCLLLDGDLGDEVRLLVEMHDDGGAGAGAGAGAALQLTLRYWCQLADDDSEDDGCMCERCRSLECLTPDAIPLSNGRAMPLGLVRPDLTWVEDRAESQQPHGEASRESALPELWKVVDRTQGIRFCGTCEDEVCMSADGGDRCFSCMARADDAFADADLIAHADASRASDLAPEHVDRPGRECAICHERMSRQEPLACGHRFHRRCIGRWLSAGPENQTCPICRRDVA